MRRMLQRGGALLAGSLFGVGVSVSGMIDPGRVLGFLDVASGHWDPSLLWVLGGAVAMAIPAVMWQRRLSQPWLDTQFHLPTQTVVDRRLLLGAALFGAGWGLAGFCPGPALAALSLGPPSVWLFCAAMAIGMRIHDRWLSPDRSR